MWDKRLIFHLWVPLDFTIENKVYKMHLNCIENFKSIFSKWVIVLSMDDINNTEIIKSIEKDFIKRGIDHNIEFKIVENNKLLREAVTCYNNLFNELNSYDGITFFCHSKGMCNISTKQTFNGENINEESINRWICALYYLNLNYFDYVQKMLIGDIRIVFGALLTKSFNFWKKEYWQYNGSFYWINTKKLYDYIKVNNKYLPQCTDRTYAETVLSRILPFDFNYIMSLNGMWVDSDQYMINMYENSDLMIKAVMTEEEYINFNNFYKKIIDNV